MQRRFLCPGDEVQGTLCGWHAEGHEETMESGGLAGIFLGLASAANYGLSDFLGGLSSRRARTVSVLITSQLIAVLTFLVPALITGDRMPSALESLLAVIGGLLSIAVGNLFYYALAHGRMSIVAPVGALVTTCFPVVFSIMREGAPSSLTLLGFAVALVAVFLVSSSEKIGVIEWRSLTLPVVAGVLAGLMFIIIGYTTENSTYTPLLIFRITSLLGNLLLAWRIGAPKLAPRAVLPAALMTGFSGAVATIFFVLAAQVGRLDVASVLSALSPCITALLAAVFLRERVGQFQVAGIVTATAAIILISV
jgi:drug/metabolite transporter (DMT)-like permease